MGESIARNMLSWLKLPIKLLLLHLVGCLYYCKGFCLWDLRYSRMLRSVACYLRYRRLGTTYRFYVQGTSSAPIMVRKREVHADWETRPDKHYSSLHAESFSPFICILREQTWTQTCLKEPNSTSVVSMRVVTLPSRLLTFCAFSRRPMIPLQAHRPPGRHSKHTQQNALVVPNWCAIYPHLSDCMTPRTCICKSIEGWYHWRFSVGCASIGEVWIQSAVTMFLQKCSPLFRSPSGTNWRFMRVFLVRYSWLLALHMGL